MKLVIGIDEARIENVEFMIFKVDEFKNGLT